MQRNPWTKQQQHSDQEQCEDESSSSAAVKSKVNVDRKRSRSKWRVLSRRKYPDMNNSGAKEKFGTNSRCDCCIVVSCHPPSWCPSSGLLTPPDFRVPVIFVFCLRCCSESEDSVNDSRIQYSNCLWSMFDLLSLFAWVHLQTSCIALCPLTVCVCTPCPRVSSTGKTDSFLWGHDPDTLVCKVRPSFDGCGTSLSVSLSLSLSALRMDHDAES